MYAIFYFDDNFYSISFAAMKTLSVRPLSADLAAKAKSELNESNKKIPDDLEAIKQWLSKQAHITARLGKSTRIFISLKENIF